MGRARTVHQTSISRETALLSKTKMVNPALEKRKSAESLNNKSAHFLARSASHTRSQMQTTAVLSKPNATGKTSPAFKIFHPELHPVSNGTDADGNIVSSDFQKTAGPDSNIEINRVLRIVLHKTVQGNSTTENGEKCSTSRNMPKSISCGICGQQFRWPSQLQSHSENHTTKEQEQPDEQRECTIENGNSMDDRALEIKRIIEQLEENRKIISSKVLKIISSKIWSTISEETKSSEIKKIIAESEENIKSMSSDINKIIAENKRSINGESSEINKDIENGSVSSTAGVFNKNVEPCEVKTTPVVKNENPLSCSICGKEFPRKALLGKHALIHSAKVHKCKVCGKAFTMLTYLRHHQSIHMPDSMKLACQSCPKKFAGVRRLRMHQMLVHIKKNNSRYCRICFKRFSDDYSRAEHKCTRSENKPHVCGICGACFHFPSGLKQHCTIHSNERPFQCSFCGRRFKLRVHLKNHFQQHDPVKTFGCQVCGKVFSTAQYLGKHRFRHSGIRFSCHMCGKTYATRVNVREHITRAHTKIKNCACELCPRKYYTKRELKLHLRSHTGEKAFACSSCPMTFKTGSQRNQHSKIHSSLKAYQCDKCSLRYHTSSSLRAHIRIHHQLKIKQVPLS